MTGSALETDLESPLGRRSAFQAVYILRPGDINDEFRVSLRSLERFYGDDVELTVVGNRPGWLTGDYRWAAGNVFFTKQENVYDNVIRACEIEDLPDRIVIMNDDFVILKKSQLLKTGWRCSLDQHIDGLTKSWWKVSLEKTRDWLTEQPLDRELLSYELHRPFPINRHKMVEVLRAARDDSQNPAQWRTLYGNYWDVQGDQMLDGKVYASSTGLPDMDVVSTTDQSFRMPPGKLLQKMYSEPSRWESS